MPDQYVQITPLAPIAPQPVIAVASPATNKGKSKAGRGLGLEFNWHIPFTSRKSEKEKTKVTLVSPTLPPVYQNGPFIANGQFTPTRDAEVYSVRSVPREERPSSRQDRANVVVITPRDESSHSDERRSRPPVVRVHQRRSRSSERPEPVRRNHSRGRLQRINERLRELEDSLQDARKAARQERITRIMAEIREERIRRDQEAEAEARWLEQEAERERFDRERRERYERDRRRSVEIHQTRNEGFADRGDRVIAQAIRAERERDLGLRGGLLDRGFVRRELPSSLRRVRMHVGEAMVYDDDRVRVWNRHI